MTEPEKRLWESRRITPLQGTLEEFLRTLDTELPNVLRGVVTTPTGPDLPISERFVVRSPELSATCLEFLENDVEYVRNGMPTENLDAKLFYRGFNPQWAAVERDLDVRRDIEDTILSDAILNDDGDMKCQFYAIKGHAGSGKSVLLQRIAWEAALSFGKLCLYLRPHGQLSFDSILELSRLVDERIYVFVDDVGEQAGQTLHFIEQARRASLPVTICAAERTNEWNMSCEDLDPYVTNDFEVRYLSPKEIDDLLQLLDKSRALFQLEHLSQEERKAAFVDRAGRQLLVALHEATLGKPFEDIIADEFNEIQPDHARLMYLGISFLNRFEVPVRAGLVSRIYGVRFTDFQERFFQPLEGLVFSRYDYRTRDYVYETRHPHIAEIVVSRALREANDKRDAYMQIIGAMNIDYTADRRAYRKLVRGRTLLREFVDHQIADAIYTVARTKVGEDAYLLHQMAIYEMNRSNGNLNKAAQYLTKAKALQPHDSTIAHSLAELQLRRAENAPSELEFRKHLKEAQQLANSLNSKDSHGFHTLAKSHLAQLRRLMEVNPADFSEIEFGELIKSAEQAIQRGLERAPGDSYLLDTESRLANLLAKDDRAVAALRAASKANPQNAYIAIRLAKLLVDREQAEEAIGIYKSTIESGVNDKRIHFNYARLLIECNHEDGTQIEYHLRRGFTEGDASVDAQFWYARQLYVNEKMPEAQDRFRKLQMLAVNPAVKRSIRGCIRKDGADQRFTGRVDKVEADYGFALRDGTADRVFLHVRSTDPAVWGWLKRGVRISFSLGFNYWGAAAVDVALE